jgi:uncharacterized membrane protein YgaE (UPF0421/DUF939 family)
MPLRSVVPELPVTDVLTVGSGRIDSIRTTVRIAIAVTVSYELAAQLHANDLLLMAPMTTLFVVQGSPLATFGSSVQRILGTCVGVILATLWVEHITVNLLTFAIAVFGALLLGRLLPVGLTGQMQVASGALYVLVLGNPAGESGFWRVGDVIIGGLVGIAAVFVLPPKPQLESAEQALDQLLGSQAAQLRRIAAEIGTLSNRLAGEEKRHAFDDSSVALADLEAAARQTIAEAEESLRFRVRTRVGRERLVRLRARMDRLAGLNAQIRAISGAADRLYDRENIEPALSSGAARALLRSCADLVQSIGVDPVTTTRLAADAQDRLAAALSDTAAGGVSVARVLESISLLGRIELLIETEGRSGLSEDEPGAAIAPVGG